MLRHITRKTISSLLVLPGVVVIVFFLFMALPGDPAQLTLGQRSDVQTVENIRHEMGLDQPVWKQLLLYLNDLSPLALHTDTKSAAEKYHFARLFPVGGDKVLVLKFPYLRTSYQDKGSVSAKLMEALPRTIILALAAMFFASLIGVILGVIAAVRRSSWVDHTILTSTVIGISVPSFFSAIVLQWLFGYVLGEITGLHLTGSLYDVDAVSGKEIINWSNLILPALTLGVRPLAIITQLTRSSMLDVLQSDFIRTAKAKGLGRIKILFRHALRNALNPVITGIGGWLGELLAGAFFVEFIFGWNGMGKLTVDALEKNDLPVLMGAVIVSATLLVLINILTEIAYSIADPRIRAGA